MPNSPHDSIVTLPPNPPAGGDGSPFISPPEPVAPLSKEELDRLYVLEAQIEGAWIAQGLALKEIHDKLLYRVHYGTFEIYCEKRWTKSRSWGHKLIKKVGIAERFMEHGLPAPNRQAHVHPLQGLKPEQQIEAWRAAQRLRGDGSMTKSIVEDAVKATVGERVSAADTDKDSKERPKQKKSKQTPQRSLAEEFRHVLRRAPAEHRDALVKNVEEISKKVGLDPDETLVAEVMEGYMAAVVEDGLTEPASLVGTAAELTASSATHVGGDGQAGAAPIPDLDILDDAGSTETDPEGEQRHASRIKNGVIFTGSDEKRPLLVSIPRIVAPSKLTADLPEKARQVIVEIGELERMGGPVTNGVLDVLEVLEASREARIKRQLTETNENVDWARYTSNPSTGCWHGCREVFCYAAGIAHRLFPQGFIPTLYPARLDHLRNTKLPDVSGLSRDEAWRNRSVFFISMGDLFGSWMPAWYIEHVLRVVGEHPEWFVFFLTKNPARLGDFTFPSNCAVGLTITGDDSGFSGPMTPEDQLRVYEKLAGKLGRVEGAEFTWLSLEPFRAPVHDLSPFFHAGVKMVAMGGQSRTSFSPAFQPEMAWVESARTQVRSSGLHLFEKENLIVKPKEIPFPATFPPSA